MVTCHPEAVLECRKEEINLKNVLLQFERSLSVDDHKVCVCVCACVCACACACACACVCACIRMREYLFAVDLNCLATKLSTG